MRAMHPKSPAERRWGMHRANILPPRGAFAVRSPQIMHGARILPSSGGPAPAHGLLPEQPHRGIAFHRLGPCSGGGAHPGAPPMPATCQCLPLAVPVAARGKPPMGFGGGHPAQNLRRRPQAGPGRRQRCQKRPSKGRVPLGGTIGTPHPFPIAQKSRPQELTPGSALSAFLAAYNPSEFQAVLRSALFRLDAVRFSGLPRLLSSDSVHRN